MSSKKSLFTGLVIGSLAAGATMYFLKTEEGTRVKSVAKEKLEEAKDQLQDFLTEHRYTPEEIKTEFQHLISQVTDNFHSQEKGFSVSTTFDASQELKQLKNDLDYLEQD